MDINIIYDNLKILAIPNDSEFTVNDIENHYRMLSKMYHPDMKKVKNSDERFIKIKEARDFLVDNFDVIKLTIKESSTKVFMNDNRNDENIINEVSNYKSKSSLKKILIGIAGFLFIIMVVLPLISLIIMLLERQ